MSKSFSYSVKYTYDKLNRLTSAVYSNGVGLKYSYDQVGNLTSISKGTKPLDSHPDSCRNCLTQLLPETKFCVECGTLVSEAVQLKDDLQSNYCTSCKQEVPKGSRYCTNCGSPQ